MVAPSSHYQHLVMMTDFNCGIANAQIELRFRNVFRHYAPQGNLPAVINVQDIPFGNTDYAAYALYCCHRALGRTRPNVFIHVCDPGVGHDDDRSILITDLGNAFIGPNNSSLGLIANLLAERNIGFELYALDREKIEALEQQRMDAPTYSIPRTFHARDVFAVAAGLIAAGVDVKTFTKENTRPRVVSSPFAKTIRQLPVRLKTPVPFYALRDNTFGNLKFNLTLDALGFDALVDEQAEFKISRPDTAKNIFGKKSSLLFKAAPVFGSVPAGTGLLYLGSTFAPMWDERFVELAINMASAAEAFGINPNYTSATELCIERIR